MKLTEGKTRSNMKTVTGDSKPIAPPPAPFPQSDQMKPIPIKTAKDIAKDYGYDQVIIYARKTGEKGGEHMTTYGKDKEHCEIAGQCGKFLQEKVMGWHDDKQKGWKDEDV